MLKGICKWDDEGQGKVSRLIVRENEIALDIKYSENRKTYLYHGYLKKDNDIYSGTLTYDDSHTPIPVNVYTSDLRHFEGYWHENETSFSFTMDVEDDREYMQPVSCNFNREDCL